MNPIFSSPISPGSPHSKMHLQREPYILESDFSTCNMFPILPNYIVIILTFINSLSESTSTYPCQKSHYESCHIHTSSLSSTNPITNHTYSIQTHASSSNLIYFQTCTQYGALHMGETSIFQAQPSVNLTNFHVIPVCNHPTLLCPSLPINFILPQ